MAACALKCIGGAIQAKLWPRRRCRAGEGNPGRARSRPGTVPKRPGGRRQRVLRGHGVTTGDLLRGSALRGRWRLHPVDRHAFQERHDPGDRLVPPAGEAGALLRGRLRRPPAGRAGASIAGTPRHADLVGDPPDRRRRASPSRRPGSRRGRAVPDQRRVGRTPGRRDRRRRWSRSGWACWCCWCWSPPPPGWATGAGRPARRAHGRHAAGGGSASAGCAARSWSPPRG